jgi:pimeloyl-ACP methyl ester carboxylesterase
MSEKKVKVPIALRMVRWWFPKLEKYAPPLALRLFVQVFFTPLHFGFPSKELEWIKKSVRTNTTVNGKRAVIYSWGDEDKPFVLFIHGWAGRATQFFSFFPFIFEAGYRVVAFDGPAHGKSEGKQTNLLEFEEMLKVITERMGKPVGAIAHSFGGVATLMAIANGLAIDKLVNIGVPTIGDLTINTFLNAVNGNKATAEQFKKYIIEKYNRSFDEFSALHFMVQIKSLELLLIHDEKDKDVSIEHAERIVEIYPQAQLLRTNGLGHTRILRDEAVIKASLQFILPHG